MAMSLPCGGCGIVTSFIFAAQYTHKDQRQIICVDCYDQGIRCWFLDGRLVVSKIAPEGANPAVLYWNEGGHVTGGGEPITYPETTQPEGNF